MPNRAAPLTDPAAAEAIGEIRGQLREIIHTQNDNAQRYEAQGRVLMTLASVPEDVRDIKLRVTALETAEHRREGERGVLHAIVRSPVIAWFAAGLAMVVTYVKGWLHS